MMTARGKPVCKKNIPFFLSTHGLAFEEIQFLDVRTV
jgi:hypothetical protein